MGVSVATGIVLLVAKSVTAFITGSAAILSDASESVVHVVAVAFAAWSLRVARKKSDGRHPFGYDKISFFSAGFEGAMIIAAALFILYESIRRIVDGPRLEALGLGTAVSVAVVAVNGVLGLALIRAGKKHGSLIVEANGRHVLTDSVTSLGVVLGLLLCLVAKNPWFDSAYFDPVCAILVALNILREGFKLVRRSASGLMDSLDPAEQKEIEATLNRVCGNYGVSFHELRVRNSGQRYWFQFHVIFDRDISLREAHSTATAVERAIENAYPGAMVTTHLESAIDHASTHGAAMTGHGG